MSHYSVLVVGEDIASQLEPYNENTQVEPYIDGTAESGRETLIEALDYYQHKATEKKYVGRGLVSLTQEERLALLEDYSGGVWLPDANGDLIRYSTYNPASKWDWYEVGGRWSGFFPVVKGTPQDAFEPSTVHWSEKFQGEDSVDDSVVGTIKAPDLTDSALKMHIDFSLMRKQAEIKALQMWQEFEEATKGLTSPGSWSDFARNIVGPVWDLEDMSTLSDLEREGYHARLNKAREEFGKQPFVAASRKLKIWGDVHAYFLLDEPDPKTAFIQRSINTSTTSYAVVMDGEWIAKGDMGWFGMSNDKVGEDEWDAKVNELIDSLPQDTLLTLVDVHI